LAVLTCSQWYGTKIQGEERTVAKEWFSAVKTVGNGLWGVLFRKDDITFKTLKSHGGPSPSTATLGARWIKLHPIVVSVSLHCLKALSLLLRVTSFCSTLLCRSSVVWWLTVTAHNPKAVSVELLERRIE